jgi:hypothetical protein
MIAKLEPDERKRVCEKALLSRFGPVRAIGLREYLHGTTSHAKRAKAVDRLLDVQASVRAVAIEWLGAHQVDAREHYHQVLAMPASTDRQLVISLTSLVSFGQGEDAGLARAFVTHHAVRVRATAYASWFKLAPHDKDLIALQALADEADRVKKMAVEMVTRRGAFIPFATACTLLVTPRDWSRLLRLGGNGKWDELEAIARIAPGPDAQMRTKLESELASWMEQEAIYTRPTAAQAAFLRSEAACATLGDLAGCDVRAHVERKLALALSSRY